MLVPSYRIWIVRLALGFLGLMPSLQAQAPTITSLRAWQDGLAAPGRIATDANGTVYVSDASLGTVSVRDEWGRLVSTRTGLSTPLGVAVDQNGRILVAEAGTGKVSIFNSAWTLLGQLGMGEGEFALPNHIAVSPAAPYTIFVVDSARNQIKAFAGDGTLVREFGTKGTGPGAFDFPAGIAVTATDVFIADQNNDRIQVLDHLGSWRRTITRNSMLGSKFGRLQGLAIDSRNRLLVADAFQGTVHVMDPESGALLGTIGDFGDGLGQLQGPSSLVVDRNGRLFVASIMSGRVDLFGMDNYSDPTVLQAIARISASDLVRDDWGRQRWPKGMVPYVQMVIAVPPYAASAIFTNSVTLNGIPALDPPGVFYRDYGLPGGPSLCAAFDLRALLATLPDGQVPVTVRGLLPGSRPFEATLLVTVKQNGDAE